jgi:hypothetical protein
MGFVGGFRSVGATRSVRRYPAFIENLSALVAQSVAGSTSFVRRDGTLTMTGATWNTGGATDFTNVQKMIIGSTFDQNWGLQIEEASGIQLLMRSSSVNNVTKEGRIAVSHRLNAEQPLTLFYGFSSAGSGIMNIGGGSGALNAATDIRLWTAANNITLEGTEMVRVANAVGVRIESGITGDPANLFHVESAVRTALLVEDATGIVEYNSRFAQIYVEGASAAQAITTGGTYEKFTGFVTNGDADGATADAANDKITLTDPGYYLVTFQVSYSGTANSTWDFQSRWNGNVQAQLHCTRKLGAGGDVGSCSFCGIIDATSGSTDLEVWMTSDSNGDSMTAQDAQLNATWLGTT